ncbi:type II toxin-antitoxin system death-on-curing family toxin [Chryseobacterium oryzae]|uniref:Type II toxin-antitoxin system death-on-curing family toxin n=1 Tax=Chryseobacterium oryzae TaxID=2929799 RepID=A0ABY4BH13_9FLAO|nr:type II toxin-antitoxin system death-on-curing family toxin [Chryseobacterium oryzae]UOE38184.1 type II toxin-antitoxin system death-on-curing family toxin [Chryseobacterium oryzae]
MLLYFPKEFAIKIHDKILDISGGHKGIKDEGNIESPLYHIQQDIYYPYLEDKLTHLVFCFNKFHAFNDGNKRTSIALGAFFLQTNGFGNIVNKFIREMENIAVAVADNVIGKELLHDIIASIIYDDDYDEIIKLKIFDTLNSINKDVGINLADNNTFWDLY